MSMSVPNPRASHEAVLFFWIHAVLSTWTGPEKYEKYPKTYYSIVYDIQHIFFWGSVETPKTTTNHTKIPQTTTQPTKTSL